MKPTYYFPEHYKIHCLTDINSTINIHYSFIRSLDYVKNWCWDVFGRES